ncbi:TPA: putative phosphatase phospho1 [Trebouxia sp. C0004]
MPDRQETLAFLETASKHGFIWRCLRQVQKPDLLTPVSIYQLVLGPKPSQDVLQLQVSPCQASVSIPGDDKLVPAAAALASEAGRHDDGCAAASQPSRLSSPGTDKGEPGISVSVIGAQSPGTIASSGRLSLQCGNVSSLASRPSPGTVLPPQSMLGDGSPAALPLGRTSPSVLLVLDFDWSMIEENSDTFVVHELGGWDSFQRLQAQGLPWTELMDAAMVAVHSQQSRTAADIKAACVRVPMHHKMHEVLQETSASSNVLMVILSDANTVFIDYILQAQGLQGCFNDVITNPARFVDGALRISPYHEQRHGCAACPPNLCKGLVIEELLLQHNYRQVIYLGDGRGDYCPCTRLGPNDHILARQHYPDGSECSLLRLLTEQGRPIKDCRQCLSPFQKPVGNDWPAAGSIGEASKQGNEALTSTGESSDVSVAKISQAQQTDAADFNDARCQGIQSMTNQPPETEQQSRLSSLPLDEEAKDSSCWQHASVYSWSAAADAANLIQLLLNVPIQR